MSSNFPMAPSSPLTVQRSPWHSPVPYLFGGLAAMMALIAFALLILACSYWKLSRRLHNAERDLEAGTGDGDVKVGDHNKVMTLSKETYLVIMAGQEKPTFLATPSSSRTSSFGSSSSSSSRSGSTTTSLELEIDEGSDQ